MYHRVCNPLKSNSFFLFGARGTGKSTLLRSLWVPSAVHWVDLLNTDLEQQYLIRPMALREELERIQSHEQIKWVVIDEIQKAPKLLDVVHSEIERGRFKFAITGSSARKLKRGAANLLAGRAFVNSLHPLTHLELGESFDLQTVLQWGSLPKVFSLVEEGKREFLSSYANTYIKEEVQMEQWVRKVVPFRAFLQVASQSSGQIINHSKIARDVSSDPVSIRSYFEILEDTLLGFTLKPFHYSIRKRQSQHSKFYFFDLGVQNTLSKTLTIPCIPGTYEYGRRFEQFVILEIHRLSQYKKDDWEFSYLHTKDNAEIDLIIERPGEPTALVEIKSTTRVTDADLRHLLAFSKDFPNSVGYCLSQDPMERKVGSVVCVPWQKGIQELNLAT